MSKPTGTDLIQGGCDAAEAVFAAGRANPDDRPLVPGIATLHDDRLWFSDWGAHEVIAVDPAGRSEVILRVPSFPFSIDWSPDGRLLIISGNDRRLLRRDPDGALVTHADLTGLLGLAVPGKALVQDHDALPRPVPFPHEHGSRLEPVKARLLPNNRTVTIATVSGRDAVQEAHG